MKFLILIFLLPQIVYSQDTSYLDNDLSTLNNQSKLITKEDQIDQFKDDNVDDEIIIKVRNPDTKVFDSTYKTSQDTTRFSFLYHLNLDPIRAADVTTLEAIAARRIKGVWYEISLGRTTATFDEITSNNTASASSTSAESLFPRDPNEEVTVTSLGLGVGYRFRFFKELWENENLFEQIMVTGQYVRMQDQTSADTFTGPGLKVDYGLHYRTSPGFHWGPRFSWNYAIVKRPQAVEGEASRERSFILNWASVSIDISFYL